MTEQALLDEVRRLPLELARHIVHGAIDYATALGFEPDANVAPGIADDPVAVVRTLHATLGPGNFAVAA